MGYQFFLPMVLRWRASRAEASLKIQLKSIQKELQKLIENFSKS